MLELYLKMKFIIEFVIFAIILLTLIVTIIIAVVKAKQIDKKVNYLTDIGFKKELINVPRFGNGGTWAYIRRTVGSYNTGTLGECPTSRYEIISEEELAKTPLKELKQKYIDEDL